MAQPDDPLLDWDRAVEQVDGQEDILRDLIGSFHQNVAELSETIQQALERHHGELAANAAHRLKAATAMFGAEPVATAAAQLERLARRDELAPARREWAHLQSLLARLKAELNHVSQTA